MNELAQNRTDTKENASANQEVDLGEDLGQQNEATFGSDKNFNPKLSGHNQMPLTRESVMRLQHVIGNQAVMRLISSQKQPAPVSPTTIQRKIQVDFDQFKGLSHFGNKLQNSTFIQIKNTYKTYLKTNDPAKETKLIGELLKLCDQWMINHTKLQKNKDPKKLDVITNLKLAIAEEAATKQQVATDKNGKKVTFDPKGPTIIKPQPQAVPNPVVGGTPDVPPGSLGSQDDLDSRILDIGDDSGSSSDADFDSRILDIGDDSATNSSSNPQSNPSSQTQTQDNSVSDQSNSDVDVADNSNQVAVPDTNLDPRGELTKRVGFPPAFIQGLSQPDFELLVKADKALDDGDVVEADQSFTQLRASLSDVVNMLKGFLMRFHIGNIHPELAKMMDTPDFVATGDQATKAQSYVTGLANKFHQDATTAGKTADPKYLRFVEVVGEKQDASNQEFNGLSLQEATALVGYLSDLYPNYNSPLRGGIGKTSGANAFGENSLNLTATAISALNKMTPYAGMVYRHSGIFPGYLEMHQAGAVIPDMAFMSSAKTQGGTQGAEKHDALEILRNTKTGKDMEEAAWFGGESEILFKPGTRFHVVMRMNLTDMPNGKWPTDAEAVNLGYNPDQLLLIQYLNSDGRKSMIKYLILKQEV